MVSLRKTSEFLRALVSGNLQAPSNGVDLKPLVNHRFKPDQIEAAYELFGNQRDGVLKVAIP